MKAVYRHVTTITLISLVFCFSPLAFGQSEMQAKQILEATGIKGGLIVHIGCGEGKLTAALRNNERYIVHGLDTDTGNVQRSRKNVDSLGIYGPVSFDVFSGRKLPYVRETNHTSSSLMNVKCRTNG